MKKANTLILSLISIFVGFSPAKANFAAGGELIYVHLSDSTYQFFFKLYRDCTGSAEPSTVPLCLFNSCTNQTITYQMSKFNSTARLAGPICPNAKTTCDNPGAALAGYKEWIYSKIVTLPSRCNYWKISTYVSNRNASDNIQNATSQPLYLEATFDNTVSLNNSSPYVTRYHIPYIFKSWISSLNDWIQDPDGDSIVTTVVYPLTGVSSCTDTPKNVSFVSATPQLSIPNNPFQTNGSFVCHPIKNRLIFSSINVGKGSVATKTSEYRNGKLIGSVMRETQIQTLPNTTLPYPSLSIGCLNGGTLQGSAVQVCAGQPVSFCYDIVYTDKSIKAFVGDNHSTSFPGSGTSYSTQGADSIRGTFSWTPSLFDNGKYSLQLNITDSTCNATSIVLSYQLTIEINVLGKIKTREDTSICSGDVVQLPTKGTGNFLWSILPGGSMGSLSCTTCAAPYATPTVSTTYVVSTPGHPCNFPPDTVTVNIKTAPVTVPVVTITVSPDSNVTPKIPVTFNAAVTGCNSPSYQWTANGLDVTGANSSVFNPLVLYNNYRIACKVSCNDTCPRPRDTVSNVITMHISGDVNRISRNKLFELYPNPNNGKFTLAMLQPQPNEPIQVEIVNQLGQCIYKQRYSGKTHTIDLDDVPEGIYLLRIKTDGGSSATRFLVNR